MKVQSKCAAISAVIAALATWPIAAGAQSHSDDTITFLVVETDRHAATAYAHGDAREQDIPLDELADKIRAISASLDHVLSGVEAQEGNYAIDSVEMHVVVNAETNLVVVGGGVESGIKLVFRRLE